MPYLLVFNSFLNLLLCMLAVVENSTALDSWSVFFDVVTALLTEAER